MLEVLAEWEWEGRNRAGGRKAGREGGGLEGKAYVVSFDIWKTQLFGNVLGHCCLAAACRTGDEPDMVVCRAEFEVCGPDAVTVQ